MDDYTKIDISIGSNIGDKLKNLEKAIELIHLKIAVVESISSIYKTEAIGFKGEDFLNICISIFSNEIPSYIMQNLLDIEKILVPASIFLVNPQFVHLKNACRFSSTISD